MVATVIAAGKELTVGIVRPGDADGVLALEPVRCSDLVPARDETWWLGVCSGVLPPELQAHTWRLVPGESAAGGRLKGYAIELAAGPQVFRKHFDTATLDKVARRAVARLYDQHVLTAKDDYRFFITGRPCDGGSSNDVMPINVSTAPLLFEAADLQMLRDNSSVWIGPLVGREPFGEEEVPSEAMEILCSRDVWDEGREMARAGGKDESAAVFTGHLVQDTASTAVALLLDECLQAEHAREERFAVEFTGETWSELLARLEQRRTRLNRPAEMIVASAHGHNFGPEADATGRKMCDACQQLEICSRSTAHASQDDLHWHSVVFAGQPWATLLVWGWNARDQEEWRLYGQRDTTLQQRSIRILK